MVCLECQVLRAVLQLFDSQLDDLVDGSPSLSRTQSCIKTDRQKIPEMLLTSTEMMDRFKKIIMTSVNFVLFSGQSLFYHSLQ